LLQGRIVQESEHCTTYLCPQTAVQVGLDASRIKLALRRKVEQTGLPFMTSDALIEATLGIQINEEMADTASSSSGSRGPSPVHVHYAENVVVLASTENEGEEEQQTMPQR
jgi:hypothetical protein